MRSMPELSDDCFDLTIYRPRTMKFGVALSQHGCWPIIVNVAASGLGRGRFRIGDRLVAIDGVQMAEENEA